MPIALNKDKHMTPITIHSFTYVAGLVLVVFQDSEGYRFEVINVAGQVFGRDITFPSAEAAERRGKAWIRVACGGNA